MTHVEVCDMTHVEVCDMTDPEAMSRDMIASRICLHRDTRIVGLFSWEKKPIEVEYKSDISKRPVEETGKRDLF